MNIKAILTEDNEILVKHEPGESKAVISYLRDNVPNLYSQRVGTYIKAAHTVLIENKALDDMRCTAVELITYINEYLSLELDAKEAKERGKGIIAQALKFIFG